jgi:2-keto-4-pentenoate hydratase
MADNAWNAGVVLGEFVPRWPDLAQLEGVVRADGVELGRGFGRDALGHPFAAHTGSESSHRRGDSLTDRRYRHDGSLIKTQFPRRSTHCEFQLLGLSEVSCQVLL